MTCKINYVRHVRVVSILFQYYRLLWRNYSPSLLEYISKYTVNNSNMIQGPFGLFYVFSIKKRRKIYETWTREQKNDYSFQTFTTPLWHDLSCRIYSGRTWLNIFQLWENKVIEGSPFYSFIVNISLKVGIVNYDCYKNWHNKLRRNRT